MNQNRTVCLASSCLEVAGVPHKVKDNAILATNTKGEEQIIEVDPLVFNSQDATTVRDGVKSICTTLGYPPVDVIKRPKSNKARTKKSEATIETVLREKRICWMPNPPDYVFKEYQKVTELAARKFCRSNNRLLAMSAYSYEDIVTYCQMFLIGFWATDRVFTNRTVTQDDNSRLCYLYLRQKLAELFSKIQRQQRGYDIGDISINDGDVKMKIRASNPNDRGFEIVDNQHESIETSAGLTFAGVLAEIKVLDHDNQVEALETLVKSKFEAEAKEALVHHRITCASCKNRAKWKSYREKYKIQEKYPNLLPV